MGSRGAKVNTEKQRKSRFSEIKEQKSVVEPQKKHGRLPMTGEKVQSEYIDYVKKQISVDLSKARDKTFDDKNGFNIDTRKLTRPQYAELQRLAQRNTGDYDVQLMSNGANRIYVRVKRKKINK